MLGTLSRKIYFLSCLLFASQVSALQACNLKPDEEVIFFPAYGHWNPVRGGWEVSIHAWVFEPEKDSLAVRSCLEVFGKALGFTKAERNSSLFKERAGLFFADNERGKILDIRLGAKKFRLRASEINGHIEDTIFLSPEEKTSVFSGPEAWAQFQTDCERAHRPFTGNIQCIGEEGISVISDIDDTIKMSQVLDKKSLVARTFLKPYDEIAGMAEMYREWEKAGAVFHYVSASPWQIFPALESFLREKNFPRGTLHLKGFRWKDMSFFNLFKDPEKYKIPILENILSNFPERRFILVGDSGEKDSQIYAEIARRHPQAVTRIVIRDAASGALVDQIP